MLRLSFYMFFVIVALLNDTVIILLARLYGVGVSRSIAQSQGADTHQAFGQVPYLHEDFAFLAGKHRVLTVYPARSKPDGVGGKHHVAKDEASVFHAVHLVAGCQNDDDGWRAIVGIALHSHHLSVHPAQLGACFRVLYGNDKWLLGAMSCCGPSASLQYSLQFLVGNLVCLEAANTSSLFYSF